MQTISLDRLREIYDQHGVDISDRDASIMQAQCNEQAGEKGRSAECWARFFAQQDASEQCAEAKECAQFHCDAYGPD